jgi:O-antigen ligase
MSRFLLGIVAVLVAVWLIFAVFSAVKGLIHLALVIAILFVAYNLLMGFRRRWSESD